MQRCDQRDPARANAQALEDLGHGASALQFVFAGAPGAHGFGLAPPDGKMIARLMTGIRIDAIDIRLDAGACGIQAAEMLARWIATQPIDPARLRLCFGLDPIGTGAVQGMINAVYAEELKKSVATLREQDFRGPFVQASSTIWHGSHTDA